MNMLELTEIMGKLVTTMPDKYHLDHFLLVSIGYFIVGIFVGRLLDLPQAASVGGLVICAVAAVVLGKEKCRWIFYAVALCGGSAVLSWAFLPQQELARYVEHAITVEGQVVISPQEKYYLVLAPETIDGQPVYSHGQIAILKKYGDETVYQRGQQITFSGTLQKPLPRTNPGGFAEDDYWATQGIFYQLKAEEPGKLLRESSGILQRVNQVQQVIQGKLFENLKEEQYQLVLALLFGEKGLMDQQFYSLSQKMGIAHVFAVSGLHVGFIVAFALTIFRFFRFDRTWPAIVFMAIILVMYCLMTNLTPSAMRAAVMAMLAMLANRWLRFKDMMTVIAVAALVILLANPLALWAVGFQLSFVSTWGLIYFYQSAKRIWRFIPWPWLVDGLSVATAAQLGSLPLVAYHFYMVAFFAPLLNILVVPIIGLIVPLLLLALCASLVVPFVGEIIFLLCELLLVLLSQALTLFAGIIGTGHFYLGQPSLWGIVLYFAVLIGWREGWLAGCRRSVKLVGGLLAVILFWQLWLPSHPKWDQVTFLDVGQGSGAVVQTKAGQVIVLDGGIKADAVASYLRYSGVNHLEAVVISHSDSDHTAGLLKLFADFSVDYLIIDKSGLDDEAIQPLLVLAQLQQTQLLPVDDERKLRIGENGQLLVKSYGSISENSNSREAVSILDLGGMRVIFPGDLGSEVIAEVASDAGRVDVWAVPHHGSKNSCYPELYGILQPKLAIISAGRNNLYNHPHPEVLEALKAAQVPYARTDQQGAVTVFKSDNNLRMDFFLKEDH